MISIGKIGKPIGVKGEVNVLPLTSNILRYKKVREVYLPEKREVEYFKFLSKKIILKIKGINTYEEAYLYLKGREIKIPESEKLELSEDEYFYSDLIDCLLIDVKGNSVGKVKAIMEAGNEILIADNNGVEILIPFVKEFCKDVDIKGKTITVDIPQELLTLHAPIDKS